jgi:hypothetical protein
MVGLAALDTNEFTIHRICSQLSESAFRSSATQKIVLSTGSAVTQPAADPRRLHRGTQLFGWWQGPRGLPQNYLHGANPGKVPVVRRGNPDDLTVQVVLTHSPSGYSLSTSS